MDKKILIYRSAAKVFAKNGFEKTTVDEIAEKAKIAKGTIYYHFQSKEEIFFGLIEDGMHKIIEKVIKETESTEDPKEKLEKLLNTQLDFYESYRDFCKILFSEFWRLETRWKKDISLLRDYFKLIEKILEEGQKKSMFKKDLNVEATATALFSIIAVAGLSWTVFHKEIPKAVMHRDSVSIFLNGILA